MCSCIRQNLIDHLQGLIFLLGSRCVPLPNILYSSEWPSDWVMVDVMGTKWQAVHLTPTCGVKACDLSLYLSWVAVDDQGNLGNYALKNDRTSHGLCVWRLAWKSNPHPSIKQTQIWTCLYCINSLIKKDNQSNTLPGPSQSTQYC